jgi:hypothetical protein
LEDLIIYEGQDVVHKAKKFTFQEFEDLGTIPDAP